MGLNKKIYGYYPGGSENLPIKVDSNGKLVISMESVPVHHLNHENGAADEISVSGLSGELADNQPPKTHATNHQNGGSDEISVAGLSGELADDQPPKVHHINHENTGSDEISVAGLSGELADNQPPKAHKTSHEIGGSDELHDLRISFLGARAYLASQMNNIAAAGANYYKINLDSETYDIGADFDTANYRYVVPITGYYQVNGVVSIGAHTPAAALIYRIAIYVDPLGVGSPALKIRGDDVKGAVDYATIGLVLSDILFLNVGDFVYLYIYTTDTGADVWAGTAYTFMSIALLGV